MLFGGIDLLFVRVFAEHLDIAAQRKGGDHVLGLPDHPADEFWAEPQGKLEDPHPEKFGKEKMAQFMDKDQDTKDNDKGNNCIHDRSVPYGDALLMGMIRVRRDMIRADGRARLSSPPPGVPPRSAARISSRLSSLPLLHSSMRAGHCLGNGREGEAAGKKGLDRDFVGRIQHRRLDPACPQGVKGQVQGGKTVIIGFEKVQPAALGKIQGRRASARRSG